MNTYHGCRWPFRAGVAAMGILGLGVGVQAQPPELFDAATGQPIPGSRGMIEAVSEGAPEVVIFSVQSPEGSAATGGAAEAVVYQAIDFNPLPFALSLNYGPSTGALFPGTMMADNMGMGNGFQTGDAISSYDLKVSRSSLDPQPGLADFHVELWDGDPFCDLDIEFGTGPGGCGQPIPGTEADFVDVPFDTVLTARAVLPAKVTIPERVWMVISGSETAGPSPCRLGWLIGFIKPTVGTDELPSDIWLTDLAELQEDATGLGACCADGSACDVAGGTPCDSDPAGTRGHCSDGDAERVVIFNFGGPCVGSKDDTCAVFVASVFAPTDTTISLIPVSVGAPPSAGSAAGVISISGNEVILQEGGQRVFLEVRVGDWDPDDTGVQVRAYQAKLNATDGFVSGLQGSLTYPLVSCASDADCEAVLGTGAKCDPPGTELPPGSCSRAHLDTTRSDYMALGLPQITVVGQGLDVFWAYASLISTDLPKPGPFPLYGGSMAVEVSADARGTFTLDFFPNSSFLVDQNSQFIPLIGLVPGKVTVQVGQCCFDICGPSPGCIDGVTAGACAAQPGVTNFDPDRTCADECMVVGACCDRRITDPALRCQDEVFVCECVIDDPSQVTWTASTACSEITCEEHTGACCDRRIADPVLRCQDNVPESECVIDDPAQVTWTKFTPCSEITCEEHAGACCDRRIADPVLRCRDDVLESECFIDDPTQVSWSKFTLCSEIECLEHTGACCVQGFCTDDVPQSECESDKWFKATPCDDPDVVVVCEPQRPIPTVSAWGLVIMTLLLLTGAKIYFGRRRIVKDTGR